MMTAKKSAASAPARRRSDGALSRERVFSAALGQFRRAGFEATTMRDIAKAAGMSLGAAYHYFPSKDAIVTELFRLQLLQHQRVAAARLSRETTLAGRLRAVFETSLEVRREDRALLGSLARMTLGDSPSSLFSPHTEDLRAQSRAVIAQALETSEVPEEARALLTTAIWALHLAILLLYVRDTTPHQQKTYRVLDRVLALLPTAIALAGSPLFTPIRTELEAIIADVSASE